MTQDEFISLIKSKGARCWGGTNARAIEISNMNLQLQNNAIFPSFLINLYKITSGINLGTGYIFGPVELPNMGFSPIPSIHQINKELSDIPKLKNKTIFGRNDLFWFAFDVLGTCYMLNNTNLDILKKYDDPFKALYDCLIAGKL